MTSRKRRNLCARSALTAVAVVAAGVALTGCRTSTTPFDPIRFDAAQSVLMKPLPGDPAALYRLRVPTVGGLRMALLTSADEGRMTISETLGSAISVTAWTQPGGGFFYDLREGCRLESADLSRVLGIGAMPLPQAVLLLAGRLPAAPGDTVIPASDLKVLVEGDGWAASVTLASDPWRVMSVREKAKGSSGWSIVLGNHTGSVPGTVRLTTSKNRWAELKLIRLEWHQSELLPALPVLPWCVVEEDR